MNFPVGKSIFRATYFFEPSGERDTWISFRNPTAWKHTAIQFCISKALPAKSFLKFSARSNIAVLLAGVTDESWLVCEANVVALYSFYVNKYYGQWKTATMRWIMKLPHALPTTTGRKLHVHQTVIVITEKSACHKKEDTCHKMLKKALCIKKWYKWYGSKVTLDVTERGGNGECCTVSKLIGLHIAHVMEWNFFIAERG